MQTCPVSKTMASKLTVKSPARLLLAQKFRFREITGHEDPKEVLESEDVFKQHKLGNFRSHYSRMRKCHGNAEGKSPILF